VGIGHGKHPFRWWEVVSIEGKAEALYPRFGVIDRVLTKTGRQLGDSVCFGVRESRGE
jgi:hypothetical protein